MSDLVKNTISKISQIGADPKDDDSIRLQKSLLSFCAVPFAFAGFGWGLMYAYFGEPLAGSIPFTYGVISILSIISFGITRKYRFFRFSQLLLILLLPFFLMLSLGGYFQGSAVIMWALICPVGAMLFDEPRAAIRWFLAFLSLIIISVFLQFQIDTRNSLPPDLVIILFALNLIGFSTIMFIMVYFFVGQKNMYEEKSETLLLNILPREIVKILKVDQRTVADHYETASIMFCDIVGSTPLFADLEPVDVVDWLNEVFSMFDRLLEKYGLEKIRTIGDNYMLASGVPTPRADHATAIAALALDIITGLERLPERQGKRINFRLGINSGPVIAGVIGKTKFQYDIWGDTVNVASRMESHGEAGKIQISAGTYELIKDEFECEYRGPTRIKGKEELETWFLIGARNS